MELPRRAVAYFAERVGYEEFAAGAPIGVLRQACSSFAVIAHASWRTCASLASLRAIIPIEPEASEDVIAHAFFAQLC